MEDQHKVGFGGEWRTLPCMQAVPSATRQISVFERSVSGRGGAYRTLPHACMRASIDRGATQDLGGGRSWVSSRGGPRQPRRKRPPSRGSSLLVDDTRALKLFSSALLPASATRMLERRGICCRAWSRASRREAETVNNLHLRFVGADIAAHAINASAPLPPSRHRIARREP